MKVLFFNRFFYPDTSATSQILTDLAFHLATKREVHVVASRVPEGEGQPRANLTVHRVANASINAHGIPRRALAYLDYYLGARAAVRRLVGPGDIIVVKTDPPMLSTAIGPLALARGAKLVCWQQDVFPEVAQRYGVPGMGGASGAVLRGIRNRSLAKATRIVAIGDRMAEHLRALEGVKTDSVEVIHNWADGSAIRPVAARDNALRSQWKLEGKFVVGYSGNLGRVHEFDTLLGAARIVREAMPDVVFLIVGRGPRLAEVVQRAKSLGLTNVRFEPHQPVEMLSQSLTLPDVHISALQPQFEGLVHPSKLYGAMASGRPTLFIGDTGGESARILAAVGAGISVGVGDEEKLAAAIRELRDSPARCEQMGASARRAFEAQFDRPVAFSRWEALLDRVAD